MKEEIRELTSTDFSDFFQEPIPEKDMKICPDSGYNWYPKCIGISLRDGYCYCSGIIKCLHSPYESRKIKNEEKKNV